MERLEEAITSSKECHGCQGQAQQGEALLERVRKELDIGRAIATAPTVKLPQPADQVVPANYWGVSTWRVCMALLRLKLCVLIRRHECAGLHSRTIRGTSSKRKRERKSVVWGKRV